MKYQNFITSKLEEASKIALEGYGKVIPRFKDEMNEQVLTDTDLAVGKFLIEEIKADFPEHNIIDEEAGSVDNQSNFTWTIDPIDGTANYGSKIPMFGIMLGLIENDEPIAGGIILPYFKELYYAEKGAGAYLNSEPIKVTGENELNHSLMTYLFSSHLDQKQMQTELGNLSALIPKIMSLRTSNSTAFDGAMIASGRYGVGLNTTSYIWDCVPLHILIEEAGGIFTDYNGKKMDYSDHINKFNTYLSFCAGSKTLHKQVQEVIKPI